MGILAISEYIRHGKRNVFIVFQMAALLFVLCVSASTLLAEYRLYRPFAQLNHKEGLYLSAGIPWCKSGCYCKGHGKG